MITAFAVLIALLISSFFALYIAITKRIVSSIRPEEIKSITNETLSAKDAINDSAEKQIQEVKNATSEELLARVRARVMRGANSSTTSSK